MRKETTPAPVVIRKQSPYALALILATAIAGTPAAKEQRPASSWVWEDENGKLAYRTTETGDRLPDFSHSGYMGGGVALPDVPVITELEPGNGDDARQIQAAIDRLAQAPRDENGFRGAILLKAGEWNIESPIRIRHSGIVLRGEGQNDTGTLLRIRGFEESRSRVIEIGGNYRWEEVPDTRQPILEDLLPVGERSLTVADASGFSPGDQVILEVRRNEEWVRAIGMDRIPPRHDGGRISQWQPDQYTHFYDRVIESIDGNKITLDAPVGETIRRQFGDTELYRYEFPHRIEQVGIENLKAVAEFKGSAEENREDHAWMFTYLQAVQNAWIRDITTRHFVFGAMDSTATAKWITVQDSSCLDPVGQIRGSRRYGFYIGGQLMLVQRCYANDDRHAFAFSSRTPGPNAFVDCLAENSHNDAGPHHRWSTAGLMDNVRVPNHSIRVQNRLHFGSGHGWAGAYFVVWNSEAEHFMIHNPPIAKNWAIGLVGDRAVPSHADPDTYPRHTHPDHIAKYGMDQPSEWGFHDLGYSGWESLGQPVRPVSLYLRQLEDRLGRAAVENISDKPYSFDPTGLQAQMPTGEGVAFDGILSHVHLPLQETDTSALTVSCWVNLNEPAGTQTFLKRGARGELFTLYLFNDHVRMLVEHAPGSYRHASTQPPAANTWVHYAGTYDGQTIKLYVNGELVDSTPAPGRIPDREDHLFIGATSPMLNVVNGRMEDVRLYREALSREQILQVRAGKEPDPTSCILRLAGNELEEKVRTDIPVRNGEEPALPFAVGELPTTNGFRGIWYINGRSEDGLHKYSGGLGTYPQQHSPIAIYADAVDKTFFTYGGARKDRNRLLHMVSAYDHATGKVARPRILLDKMTSDAHDNPTMAIDSDGYIWIFSNAHGTSRPSYIHRSNEPYSIEAFTRKVTTNFSYSNSWNIREHGFVFLHTRYAGGRVLFVQNSENGLDWSEPRKLAHIAHGHYQISLPHGSSIGTAFNYHPPDGSPLGRGLNYRTNLYYMTTPDGGQSWRNASDDILDLPLTEALNPALVAEYESQGLIVYLKDIQYTSEGHPVILYLTTPGWESGPQNSPRTFTTARWTGADWQIHPVTTADNNYDFASLYIEADDRWRLIGSTEPGPQPYNTGGEIAMWLSSDKGNSWKKIADLTRNSEYNHTYPRRPLNAHPDFYAFWADGHGRKPSPSRLYFTTRDGAVYRLPESIEGDAGWVTPERL